MLGLALLLLVEVERLEEGEEEDEVGRVHGEAEHRVEQRDVAGTCHVARARLVSGRARGW